MDGFRPYSGNQRGGSLIGSTEERNRFFKELKKQVAMSEAADRGKEQKKKETEQRNKEKVEENIHVAREESEELEQLRRRREFRVPREPEDHKEQTAISVRHTTLGNVTRKFKTDATMNMVYDWVGLLCLLPKYFNLSTLPLKPIYPDQNIVPFGAQVLATTEQDYPLHLSASDHEASFFEGQDYLEQLDKTTEENAYSFSEDDFSPFPIGTEPPNVLMSGEELQPAKDDVASFQVSYSELEARRREQSEKLKETLYTIVPELLQLYEDKQVMSKKLVPTFEEEDSSGDGVLHELYTLFWDGFIRNKKLFLNEIVFRFRKKIESPRIVDLFVHTFWMRSTN